MTEQQHPITPPPELVQQWVTDAHHQDYCSPAKHIATQAARWGADQELEACCEWLVCNYNYPEATNPLRTARRPKPPSLKEQALQALNRFMDTEGHKGCTDEDIEEDYYLIRKAVESMPS